MYCLFGCKRWTLFHPDDIALLYPDWSHGGLHPRFPSLYELQARPDRYPLFRTARRREVIIHPGEVLFVPGGTHLKHVAGMMFELNKLHVGEWIVDHIQSDETSCCYIADGGEAQQVEKLAQILSRRINGKLELKALDLSALMSKTGEAQAEAFRDSMEAQIEVSILGETIEENFGAGSFKGMSTGQKLESAMFVILLWFYILLSTILLLNLLIAMMGETYGNIMEQAVRPLPCRCLAFALPLPCHHSCIGR